MKKTIILLTALAVFGISNLFASPGITEITEALKAVTKVYKTIPNAEYVVTWYDNYNRADYGKVPSYAEAKAWVNILLSKGATKVHVKSVYGITDEWFPPETAPNEAYVPGISW